MCAKPCGGRRCSAAQAPRAQSFGRSGDRRCWRAPRRGKHRRKHKPTKPPLNLAGRLIAPFPRAVFGPSDDIDNRLARFDRSHLCPSFRQIQSSHRKANLFCVYVYRLIITRDALRGQGKKQNSHDFTTKMPKIMEERENQVVAAEMAATQPRRRLWRPAKADRCSRPRRTRRARLVFIRRSTRMNAPFISKLRQQRGERCRLAKDEYAVKRKVLAARFQTSGGAFAENRFPVFGRRR